MPALLYAVKVSTGFPVGEEQQHLLVLTKLITTMKKNPSLEVVKIQTTGMLAMSGGVETGGAVGNEFNDQDETYGRDFDFDED